jgi:hypothetical protein
MRRAAARRAYSRNVDSSGEKFNVLFIGVVVRLSRQYFG